MMSARSMPAPIPTPDTEAFWQAASESRFLLRRCLSCARTHWYPRAICPHCLGDTEWVDGPTTGTIYSYTVMRRVPVPYAVAYVALDDGPTLLTNLVDCDFDTLHIGQPVTLAWVATEGGPNVPCFTPAAESSAAR